MKFENAKTGQKIQIPVDKNGYELPSNKHPSFDGYLPGTILYTKNDGDEAYMGTWVLVGFEENKKITNAWETFKPCGLRQNHPAFKHFKYARWMPPSNEVSLISSASSSPLPIIACLGALGILAASSSKQKQIINET